VVEDDDFLNFKDLEKSLNQYVIRYLYLGGKIFNIQKLHQIYTNNQLRLL